MLRSHRFAFAAAAIVIGLSGCGDAPRSATSGATPMVIHLGQPATSARPEASGAATDKMMAPYQIMNFVFDGTLPDLGTTAHAWQLPAGVQVDAARVARMAQLLGVEGEVRQLPADQGGGWMVGSADYTGANLNVSADGMLSWWFNPDPSVYGTPSGVACAEPGVAVDPAADTSGGAVAPPETTPVVTPATDVPTSDVPVPCEVPSPPQGVPDAATAEANAKQLLADLGYDVSTYEFETYADEWSASVTAYLMVDGHRSPLTVSVGYGAEGAVTWASGTLATPEAAGDYPLVSVQAGLDRMNAQGGMWMGYYGPAGAMVKTVANESETATEPAAGAPDAMPAPVCDPAADCYDGTLPPPETITVHVSEVRLDLTMVWDVDGTVWLLPAYTFSSVDATSGYQGSFTVIAVDDRFVTLPDAGLTPEPMPADTVSNSDGSVVSSVDSDAATKALVGVAEAEAAKVADENGWTLRVVQRDGENLIVTEDYSATRVNVAVEAGVISAVVSIG